MNSARYQRSLETQRKLLDAVIRLAKEKNYDTLTVQEICTAAGVSTGSFYHQFGSKDALVRKAYQRIDWLVTDAVSAACAELPPLEALDLLLRRYILYIRDEIGPVVAQYYRALLSGPAGPRYGMDRPYCRELCKILRRAMDEGCMTRRYGLDFLTGAVMCMIRGLLLDWVIQGAEYDLLAYYELNFSILLHGLTN